MVKGVNRNVIEINDTGSELFERAILFVKPERRALEHSQLETGARSFLRGVRIPRRILPRPSRLKKAAGYFAALGVGAALTLLVQLLL